MKKLKNFEEFNTVEYVAVKNDNPSYKKDAKKRKNKKSTIDVISVPPNHTKDIISFKSQY